MYIIHYVDDFVIIYVICIFNFVWNKKIYKTKKKQKSGVCAYLFVYI